MLISANRDDTVFSGADELDLSRNPNKHLAFAFGAHYCLGHHLARLGGRIAVAQLLRFDRLELTVPRESLRFRPLVSLRGLESLPGRMTKATPGGAAASNLTATVFAPQRGASVVCPRNA